MNKRRPLSRRTMLKGLGTAIALPMFDTMLPVAPLLRAATTPAPALPLRMAFLFVPNGVIQNEWTPKQEGRDFELPSTLEPLAAHKQDLLVLSGLEQKMGMALGDGGGDHARSAATFLTGCHPRKTHGENIKAGVSVDQLAAQHMGRQTLFPSLELGCEPGRQAGNCDSGYSCAYSSTVSWRTESMPLTKETEPRLVFERLFGGGPNANEHRAQRMRYQRSILDYVQEDAAQLQRQLSGSDHRKLEEYLVGVREIETRIEHLERLAKQAPKVTPQQTGVIDDYEYQDYREQVRLMGDLLALAFQADLTRISTVMFANEGSDRSYTNIGIKDGHHTLSHHQNDAEKVAQLTKINRFHVEQFAYFLDKLRNIKEGEGNLLDQSMIVYGSGLGDGNRHSHVDLPIVLAGRAGGTLDTGRHVRYEQNTPLNNLFLSMLDRVGAKVDTMGDSTGRLPNLTA